MEFKKTVSVSKKSGLFLVVGKRQDGMILRSLEDGSTRFFSSRLHMFTPLESITVYLEQDSLELPVILVRMQEHRAEVDIPSPQDSDDTLRAYFTKIVPDHDREKVYVSDIRKILRWFLALEKHTLLPTVWPPLDSEGVTETDAEVKELPEEPSQEVPTPKPSKKKKAGDQPDQSGS